MKFCLLYLRFLCINSELYDKTTNTFLDYMPSCKQIVRVGECTTVLIWTFLFLVVMNRSALEGDCGFLAANLYAKSVFGEDALVNVSVEKQPDGKLGGYIRIRSKTQGIALSLGDKITLKQKG